MSIEPTTHTNTYDKMALVYSRGQYVYDTPRFLLNMYQAAIARRHYQDLMQWQLHLVIVHPRQTAVAPMLQVTPFMSECPAVL